jgi:MFS family permease
MTGLGAYRQLLGNGPLMRLLTGEAISGIGDWLYIVAIFVVIYRDSGDAALVGAFGAIRLIPYVILSVPAGYIADRFDRRLVLLASDVYRATLQVIMAILVANHGSVVVIAALAILATCGSAFFYPAIGAYIPALAKDETQLGPANSAWATIQNFSYIIGPAIGGIVLALGDVTSAFILNAASFIVIVIVLWFLPPSHPKHEAGATTTPSATGDAVSATEPTMVARTEPGSSLQRRPLAGLGVIQVIGGFLGGGFQVITVVLALDVLQAGDAGNGYLNAAIGVGGLLGGFLAGALVLRRRLEVPTLLGAVVTGVGVLALGVTTNLYVALVMIGIFAAGTIIIDVVTTTVFQRLVPDELRGRGTGVLMALTTLTGAAGAFLLPISVQKAGVGVSFATLGVATVVITALGIALIGSAADRRPTLYEATMERVAKLPLFAGVTRARLEAAMHQVTEVPVTAGTAVVTEGETADRFYIIENGTFSVTKAPDGGGAPVELRKLDSNDVFGELGLLRGEARSATVTADTDGLLLALDRDDFLALVGATGRLRGRMLNLYTGYSGIGR